MFCIQSSNDFIASNESCPTSAEAHAPMATRDSARKRRRKGDPCSFRQRLDFHRIRRLESRFPASFYRRRQKNSPDVSRHSFLSTGVLLSRPTRPSRAFRAVENRNTSLTPRAFSTRLAVGPRCLLVRPLLNAPLHFSRVTLRERR